MPSPFDSAFGTRLSAAFGNAAMERITLLLNHVIAAEPVATERLRPHSGRSVQLVWTGWPCSGVRRTPMLVGTTIAQAAFLRRCIARIPHFRRMAACIRASSGEPMTSAPAARAASG